jgi:hypothetical protein
MNGERIIIQNLGFFSRIELVRNERNVKAQQCYNCGD